MLPKRNLVTGAGWPLMFDIYDDPFIGNAGWSIYDANFFTEMSRMQKLSCAVWTKNLLITVDMQPEGIEFGTSS